VWQAATHFTAAAVALWTARHLGAPVFGLVNIETRNGFFFGIPLFVRGFRANVDIMALGLVASHEVIASYGLARRIMEIGYLPVDALHRLVYPKSAALAAQGLRATWTNVKRIVTITIGIAALTALALWIGAPVLPYIFGHDYVTMPHFVQWMCFGLIMIALWVAPLEAVGSAGHHALRASLIATGAIVGVSSVFWAVQYWPTDGVIGAFWLTECTIAILAWIVYGRLIRRSDGKPAHTQATSHA
jgi:O-antigen/teichoic acid export membrane protein